MTPTSKKKDAAKAGTSPRHVQSEPTKDQEMNVTTHTTPARAAPVRMNVVTIPAMKIMDVDLLDNVRETLCTVHTALNPDNKGALDDATLFAIWATLRRSMDDLDHLRDGLCDEVNS